MQFASIINDDKNPTPFGREEIADFLHDHLDQFGDERNAILKAIAYAFADKPGQDGQVLAAYDNEKLYGVAVVNDTNMSGYIPEHILVYIAVHGEARGKGIGKQLMEKTIEETTGSIALHVEPDNPARHLYEKYGFTNKYLEMRLGR